MIALDPAHDGGERGPTSSLSVSGQRPPLQSLTRKLSKGVSSTISSRIPASVASRASAATSNLVRHVSLEVSQAKKDFKLASASSFMRSTSLSQAVESSSSFSRSCGQFTNLPRHLEQLEREEHQEEKVCVSSEEADSFSLTEDLNEVATVFGGSRVIDENSVTSFHRTSNSSFRSSANSSGCGTAVASYKQSEILSQQGSSVQASAHLTAAVSGGGLNPTNSFPNLVEMTSVTQGAPAKKKLPRTLSTSALRIKTNTRSPFWEKFWGSGHGQAHQHSSGKQ